MTSSYPKAPLATIRSTLRTIPGPGYGAGGVWATLDANIKYRNHNNLTYLARRRLMRSVYTRYRLALRIFLSCYWHKSVSLLRKPGSYV